MANHLEEENKPKLPNVEFPPEYQFVNDLKPTELSDMYSQFHDGRIPPNELYGSGVVGGIENLKRHLVSRMLKGSSNEVRTRSTSEWGPLFTKGGFIGRGRRFRR